MSPDDPRHGTYAGGRIHRADNEDLCEPCRRAEARYEQARLLDRLNGRPRTLPARGTQRRIRALVALGYTFVQIGEAIGTSNTDRHTQQTYAHRLAHKRLIYIRATTAAKVAALYDAWSMRHPATTTTQQRRSANYARTVARKHNWAPPLAWDDIDTDPRPRSYRTSRGRRSDIDEVVVERVLAGHPVPTATTAERREIFRRCRQLGRSLAEVERLTGWKAERYREADDTDQESAA